MPYLLTLPAAGALCFAAGLPFGVPALRLRGLYLALVTLGLAIALPQLIKRFDGLTEGTQGLTVEQPQAPGWLALADDQFLYLLSLAVTAGDVLRRLEPDARPGRPRRQGRPRRRDRRIDARREPRRYQDARVRAERGVRRAWRVRCTCSRSASSRRRRSR